MNIRIPDNIKALKNYDPGRSIKQLKEEFNWERTAILWNNENTLGASKKAIAAVQEIGDRVNYYPDSTGHALCRKLALRLGRRPEEIILGNGSESVLMNAIRATCANEDEMLTSEGSFVVVYNWARINNIRCVSMPMAEDYSFDLDAIKSRININTKVIYLANVNNPTGTKIKTDELVNFIKAIPDDILIIVDEAYFEFSSYLDLKFPDSTKLDFPNLLTLRTFSKAYGIAGVRLGYGIGRPEIIEAMNKVKLTFEPGVLAQAAGIGALQDEEFLEKTLRNNSQEMRKLSSAFDEIGIRYVPSLGNFIMTIWDSPEQVTEITDMLMKKGVLIRALGGPLAHCTRISIGRPDENDWLIENLKNPLQNRSSLNVNVDF